MTVVRVFPQQHSPRGGLRPVNSGRIWFAKYGRTVDGTTVVAADPWTDSASVPVRGAMMEIPLDTGYWRIREQFDGGTTRHVYVPDLDTPVDYGDLVEVDPETLDPIAVPETAWWIAWREFQTHIQEIDANTGASAAAAAESADSAAESASEAENARVSADAARVAAELARDAARLAEDEAEVARGAAQEAAVRSAASAGESWQDREAAQEAAQEATDRASEAQTATAAAEVARNAALAASVAAETAGEAAQVAQAAAEAAAASAGTQRAGAETARTEAQTARGGAETARAGAVDAAASAATARSAAQAAQTAAETARTGAETARTAATTARTGAETAKTAAEAARDVALTAPFTGTSLSTQNLNDVITPGVYYVAGPNATLEKNYPIAGIDAVVTVTRASAVRISQSITIIGGAGAVFPTTWSRRYVSSSWGAWVFEPSMEVNGGDVKVWDPLAATFRQLRTVNSGLGTVDLNTVVTPGDYAQGGTTPVTLANNYPVVGIAGNLRVSVTNASPMPGAYVTQEYYPNAGTSTGRGFYLRTYRGANGWDPWRFIATQRVDNTAGRAIYTWDDTANREQLIYGDTGWRKVTPDNGWTATDLHIRRIGRDVSVACEGINPAAASSISFLVLPAGFQPAVAADARALLHSTGTGAGGSSVPFRTFYSASGLSVAGTGATWPALYGAVRFTTDQPWPAVLPGAASSIPNL